MFPVEAIELAIGLVCCKPLGIPNQHGIFILNHLDGHDSMEKHEIVHFVSRYSELEWLRYPTLWVGPTNGTKDSQQKLIDWLLNHAPEDKKFLHGR